MSQARASARRARAGTEREMARCFSKPRLKSPHTTHTAHSPSLHCHSLSPASSTLHNPNLGIDAASILSMYLLYFKDFGFDLLPVIDNLEKKLSTWHTCVLSLGDRLALARHVLCTMTGADTGDTTRAAPRRARRFNVGASERPRPLRAGVNA